MDSIERMSHKRCSFPALQSQTKLQLPAPRKTHHVVRIMQELECLQRGHLGAKNPRDRRCIDRVVAIQRRVRNVLPICDRCARDLLRAADYGGTELRVVAIVRP